MVSSSARMPARVAATRQRRRRTGRWVVHHGARAERHVGTTRSSRRRSHRCRWPGSSARPWHVRARPGRHRYPGRWPPARRGRPGRRLSRRPRPWYADPPRVAWRRATLGRVKPARPPCPRRRRPRAPSCRPRRSASSVAASSVACWASRRGRWATGSRSSTRTRSARRPPSPTRSILGTYDDVDAALRLGEVSDVVTYELEHVAADVVDALAARVPVRPGRVPAASSPRTDSPSGGSSRPPGIAVAPWREVRTTAELAAAAGRRARPAAAPEGRDRRLRRPRPGPHRRRRRDRRRHRIASVASRARRSSPSASSTSRPSSRSSSPAASMVRSRPSRSPGTSTTRASCSSPSRRPRSPPRSPTRPPTSAAGWPSRWT